MDTHTHDLYTAVSAATGGFLHQHQNRYDIDNPQLRRDVFNGGELLVSFTCIDFTPDLFNTDVPEGVWVDEEATLHVPAALLDDEVLRHVKEQDK